MQVHNIFLNPGSHSFQLGGKKKEKKANIYDLFIVLSPHDFFLMKVFFSVKVFLSTQIFFF